MNKRKYNFNYLIFVIKLYIVSENHLCVYTINIFLIIFKYVFLSKLYIKKKKL